MRRAERVEGEGLKGRGRHPGPGQTVRGFKTASGGGRGAHLKLDSEDFFLCLSKILLRQVHVDELTPLLENVFFSSGGGGGY